jgi:hypothetical protein
MTWNVENLFRPRAEDGPPDEASFAAQLEALEPVRPRRSMSSLCKRSDPLTPASALHGRVAELGYRRPAGVEHGAFKEGDAAGTRRTLDRGEPETEAGLAQRADPTRSSPLRHRPRV